MKIAVLGALGQLGRDLAARLPGEVLSLTRADLDLTQASTIRPFLDTCRPDLFINCAAYNLVDKAESEPDLAFAANIWGPGALGQACAAVGCKLIHFSTDYVFGLDTARTAPFTEADAPGPVSAYGLSKLAGEYLVRAASPTHLVIRTCGLYGLWGTGGKGGNFVETMLRVAGMGKPLRVVHDQVCTPTSTVDLATATVGLIAAEATGLFHVTNAGSCSWYEFAAEIFRLSGVPADLTPIPSTERSDPARRPGFSVLSSQKLATVGVPIPRPWPEALAAYLAERSAQARTPSISK
jgi:dTDP-4-dehydrorhamnose reductase